MSEKENKELEVNATEPSKPAKADAPKKNKPAEKKKNGNRMFRFFREMKSELKKVAWPSKKQTINNTGIVILVVLVVGAFVWIFDGIAGSLIGALINLFSA